MMIPTGRATALSETSFLLPGSPLLPRQGWSHVGLEQTTNGNVKDENQGQENPGKIAPANKPPMDSPVRVA